MWLSDEMEEVIEYSKYVPVGEVMKWRKKLKMYEIVLANILKNERANTNSIDASEIRTYKDLIHKANAMETPGLRINIIVDAIDKCAPQIKELLKQAVADAWEETK